MAGREEGKEGRKGRNVPGSGCINSGIGVSTYPFVE